MKYMGIDYGEKRVGLSVSDDLGRLAFPHDVLSNSKKLVEEIATRAKELNIEHLIVGESLKLSGEPNAIMPRINKLVGELTALGYDVHLEPEFWTSEQAARLQDKYKSYDASAAALILQSYLDKINNSL